MGAAKKLIDKKLLRDLVPINALSAAHIDEVSRKADIEDLRPGAYLFKKGDRDDKTIYLLQGQLEFVDGANNVIDSLSAGTEQACHPVAHKQPRQVGARARGKATVARIDSNLLDVLLTWDESAGYDVVEIDSEDSGDWMTRMLQSEAFLQLPASNIHQLLMRLEAVSASAGDAIVRQGDDGDYFYIVKSGVAVVTRKASPNSREVLLAELGEGACFGEEALVSGAKRNASVMMVTDGALMRLSKHDFSELLCASLVQETDYEGALKLAAAGARWLDVRLPGEFGNQSVEGSINLPLSALRERCTELDKAVDYIVCCDTGRRSAAAAFVLSQRGFRVHALRNGLMDLPESALTSRMAEAAVDADRDAEIIPFDSTGGVESRGEDGRDGEADDALIDKLAAAESDKLALQQEVARLEMRVAELDCQLEELAGDAQEQEQAARNELEAARQELESSRQQLASGQQQRDKRLEELEQELARLRDDYQQLGQRTSAVAGERDAANRELQDTRRQLESLQAQMGNQGQTAREDQVRLEQTLQEREQALSDADTELRDLRQKLQDSENGRGRLEEQLATVGEMADDGRSQAAALQQRAEEAERGRQALEDELGEARRQIETLGESLGQAQARIEQQQSQTNAETQAQQQRMAQLQEELEDSATEVTQQRDSLAGRVERLQQEVHDLNNGRELLEQACSLANTEKDELAGRLASLQQTFDEQQRQLQAQQAHAEELQQQLQDKSVREEQLQNELQTQGRQDEARSSQWQQQLDTATGKVTALEDELSGARQKQQDAERLRGEMEARIADLVKEHKSDLDSARNALTRAQSETENVKREHSRLMESLRKAERNLERQRQDHEGELYRLRRELKEAAGESGSGLAAELEAMQSRLQEATQAREDLEIKLGERSAQLEDVQAEADGLVLQLQQAKDSARQAEQQLLDSQHTANEEMAVRIEAEEKLQLQLREELSSAVSERNHAREQLTVQQQELEDLRVAVESVRQQAASREQTDRERLEKLRQERDRAVEQQQLSELERNQARERQREIQEALDQLRAEAEVTRGLVDMQAAGGDSMLREQLDQAKKNVDVAVRLRTQAEEKNARLETELAHLRSRLQAAENELASGGRIPSLDENDPGAATQIDQQYQADDAPPEAPAAMDTNRNETRPAVVLLPDPEPARSGGGFGRLLTAAVLGALAAGGGSWWLFTHPQTIPPSLQPFVTALTGESAGELGHAEPVSDPAAGSADVEAAPGRTPDSKAAAESAATSPAMRIPDFIKGGSAVGKLADTTASTAKPEPAPAEPAPAPRPPVAAKTQPLRLYSEPLADGGRSPTLVEFQADSFDMGSGASSANFDERPRHRVQLRRFAISAHEITFAEYDRFARATGRRLPGDNGWGRGDRPVVNVSWQDADAYVRWLSEQTGSRYRLPSEAEWEFAAHAGSDSRFWWGNDVGEGHANCFDCGSEWSGRMTAPVGSFAASAFRVQDMAGNVMEWVQDCYLPDYSAAPADGSAVSGGDCSRRVVRGGAYDSPSESLRSTSRDARDAHTRLDNLGFRIVKE